VNSPFSVGILAPTFLVMVRGDDTASEDLLSMLVQRISFEDVSKGKRLKERFLVLLERLNRNKISLFFYLKKMNGVAQVFILFQNLKKKKKEKNIL
jgi:hypothetical protein